MKKIVVKVVGLIDDREKRKAMKAVSTFQGITSLAADTNAQTLTVVGDVDPVFVMTKLRRYWGNVHLDSVGDEKKPDEKKPGEKKPDEKKPGEKKPEEEFKKHVEELVKAYKEYNPGLTQTYIVHSIEENPNACTIC